MRVVVITPPDPIVTWEEAKAHLRLDGDEEQAYVESLIAAAQGHIDGPTGKVDRSFGVQTLELRAKAFLAEMTLPYGPVISVESVKHLDADGTEVTVNPSADEMGGDAISPSFGTQWPSVGQNREAVRIRYAAGYVTTPAPVKAAILLMVGDLFANRETVAEGLRASGQSAIPMSTTVDNLLAPYLVWSV